MHHAQVPGLIVMELVSADVAGASEGVDDPKYERIVAAFNARPERHLLRWPPGGDSDFRRCARLPVQLFT